MENMLTYHDIHHPSSTYLIEETKQYVMNEARANINTLANDLQVTLTIKDYNPNTTSRLDVDLIIADLEDTNRPPTTEEENDNVLYASEITTNTTIFAPLLAAIVSISHALTSGFAET
ncbi:hypothetical protein Bca4012_090347 [Brassica carinata]|uniref:Uncharacterized protein n=1 Tax=Brassica carinata TaxID=52824 RepID=A0A8X7P9Z5_BRACI|nr:hypothetical protein Bca52824_086311 [Brassica carinata]